MPDILCIGHFCADAIAKTIDSMPPKGTLVPLDKITLTTGGCANNCANAVAKLGASVGVIGKVGVDGFGEFVVNALSKNGVDTRGLIKDSNSTSSASIVMVDSSGERSFLHHYGANAVFTDTDVDYSLVAEANIIVIAAMFLLPAFDGIPTARVLKKAKELGKLTVLDTAWDPLGNWYKKLEPCLPFVDIFVPSFEEAQMLSGKRELCDMADFFLEMGAKNVIIKHGENGCYIKNHELDLVVPGFKIKVVDTTGAGDCFVGGLVTGLSNGWELKKCAVFANAVGANCCMGTGAYLGLQDMNGTINFIHQKGLEF